MKSFKGIIYKITNKINGKCYIGQTTRRLSERRKTHKWHALNKINNTSISKAIRKYGFENFDWQILCVCLSKESLCEAEKKMIVKYNTLGKDGYNETPGGECLCGKDNPFYGRKHSLESRMSMSASKANKKRVPLSKEHRKKLSMVKKGIKKPVGFGEKIASIRSFEWLVIWPSGHKEVIKNLKIFCEKEGLCKTSMLDVAKGKYKQHKNYKCKRMNQLIIRRQDNG